MKPEEIIIRAIKAEAKLKPKEKIFAGYISMTYEEFASKLNTKKLSKDEKRLVQDRLKTMLKMFNENATYRQQMMKLAGEG